MYLWDLWSRFTEFIGKDTQAENESKKTAVVIRILTLSFIAYLLIPTVFINVISAKGGFVLYLVALLAFGGIFASTYKFRTLGIFTALSVAMIIWIISFIYLFGWDVGVQHYLMVLLVLVFFVQYNNLRFKALFATGLCIFRIALYYIFCNSESLVKISNRENDSLQMINTIVIFWSISVISYIYGRDSQELESKLIAYNEELKVMANTDKLTSLYNRRKALEYIEECCKNSRDKGLCVCICDIDFFKKVNDTYGHDAGDKVLQAIGKVFRQEMKEKYMAARWGGEEFLLIFPETNGDSAFIKLCEIRRKIKDIVVTKDDVEIRITMTFGLAKYDYSGNYESMLTNADQKLYRGKKDGRDRIVY